MGQPFSAPVASSPNLALSMPYQMKFDFDFLKDRYDYELQRREQLTAALTLPVGVLTVLGGAMTAMARSFSYQDGLLTWVFGILLGLAVIAFFRCMFDLGRAYHRQTHIYLPLLGELRETREKWRAFYKELHQRVSYEEEHQDGSNDDLFQHEEHQGGVDDLFQHELEERIIDAADRNTRNNDQRSRYLFSARIAIFAVLAMTAIMGIPYVVDQVRY